MVLSIVSGIVFGLFAGLGVYVVYELSGLDVNQAKIASVKEQMDDLASQMEDMQAGVGKTQSAESASQSSESSGIEPKSRDIDIEGTNEVTQIHRWSHRQ